MGERMKMKQEKAEALKQTILNVAYELFLTHGYEKVCLADIEQGAGATRGSLIYHYRSKETLLLLTSERFIADFFRDTCPDEEVINSRTPLKDYLKAFVQMVEAQVRHFKENIVKDTKVTSASSINFMIHLCTERLLQTGAASVPHDATGLLVGGHQPGQGVRRNPPGAQYRHPGRHLRPHPFRHHLPERRLPQRDPPRPAPRRVGQLLPDYHRGVAPAPPRPVRRRQRAQRGPTIAHGPRTYMPPAETSGGMFIFVPTPTCRWVKAAAVGECRREPRSERSSSHEEK